jgi:pyridinium-3,5-bisthiocarboxylic acid mononucleotide nickel chelatase
MKIAYFDAFSGIAGDMTVGALIDAGADAAAVFAGLDSLGTGARFRAERVKKKGIMGTQFTVEHEDQKKHRHLPHIVKMIEAAELPERAKRRAVRIFEVLGGGGGAGPRGAGREGPFSRGGGGGFDLRHRGCGVALELLGVEQVFVSPINTGSGTVEADHGVMPVPTPATALLLAGKPVYASGPVTELTTPTGAAIVAALGAGFGAPPAMVIERTGFGAGTKEFPGQANLLRVLIGERSGASEATVIRVLEANIDDSTPEVLGYAMERLLAEGALDVTLQPVYMKKQRPGTLVQVLARPEDQERLAAVLLRETSTLGIRISEAERRVAAREHVEVETEYGKVRMKVSPGGAAPEFEDCRRLAESTGQPLKEIFAAATAVYRKGNG